MLNMDSGIWNVVVENVREGPHVCHEVHVKVIS